MTIGGIRSRFLEYIEIYDNGNSGSSKEINWRNGNIQKVTMSDDCTLTFTNPLIGEHRILVYNGSGSAYDLTWPGSIIWLNNDDPHMESDSIFLCDFQYEGTYYLGKYEIYST